MPNQINNNLPLSISNVSFQPNMPHYIGKCPPKHNPIIRLNYKVSGTGKAQINISDQNSYLLQSTQNFNQGSKVNQHLNFKFPLTSKLANNSSWKTVNKIFPHPLRISVRTKSVNSNSWSAWKKYGPTIWKHRCKAQTTVTPTNSVNGFKNSVSKKIKRAKKKPKRG